MPGGTFVCGSILDARLPAADVICAVGEVVNYAGASSDADALAAIARRCFSVLAPGGLFLLDVATTDRAATGGWTEGSEWFVAVHAERLSECTLDRRIVSFTASGGSTWRRAKERHVLRLWPETEISAALGEAGFRVRKLDGYAGLRLPEGLVTWHATKPA